MCKLQVLTRSIHADDDIWFKPKYRSYHALSFSRLKALNNQVVKLPGT